MTIATTEQNVPAERTPTTAGANLIREAAAVMVDAHTLAKAVCNTKMIPKHFQGNPDECAAAMLYGASLGLDPMQSVRQIYVVHGQAALYARAMVSLVLGAGHNVWTVESSDDSVTVAAQRKGSQHVESATWDIGRAKKAGYTNNEKYRTDPQAMLYSKAASEVCRKVAPDVLSGVYAVEELQMERWDDRPAMTQQQPASGAARMGAILGTTTAVQVGPDLATADDVIAGDARYADTPGGHADRRTLADESVLTKRTRGHLFALFAQKGIAEADQLAGANHILGTTYESRSEFTEADALRLIAVLDTKPDVADLDNEPEREA